MASMTKTDTPFAQAFAGRSRDGRPVFSIIVIIIIIIIIILRRLVISIILLVVLS